MLARIKECRTAEELHNIGIDVSMSTLPDAQKKPYYIAIEEQMKTLNDIMAETSEICLSDIDIDDYRFEE